MWYKIQDQHAELCIYVKPNAKTTALIKVDEQALHIAIHAKPQDGEANRELISYLSKFFKVPKSMVRLQKGEKSRHKVVTLPLTDKIRQFLQDPSW